MPARSSGRSPAEELIAQEVRAEVMDEVRETLGKERAEEVAQAKMALTIVTAICIGLGLPLAALLAGVSVRIFRWASGL